MGREAGVSLPEAGVPTVDHPFKPRGEWWTLCAHCPFGEAAHVTTTVQRREIGGFDA